MFVRADGKTLFIGVGEVVEIQEHCKSVGLEPIYKSKKPVPKKKATKKTKEVSDGNQKTKD